MKRSEGVREREMRKRNTLTHPSNKLLENRYFSRPVTAKRCEMEVTIVRAKCGQSDIVISEW